MALDLSTILISGECSLIQAKQVRDYSAPQGKSIVTGSFNTCLWIKETYETIEVALHLIKNSIYGWNICKDLKAMGHLLGLKIVDTKNQC